MPTPPITREMAEQTVKAVNDALRAGYRPPGVSGNGPAALTIASGALGIARGNGIYRRLHTASERYDLRPDWSIYAARAEVKVAQQGWAPELDLTHPLPEGMVLKGTSIRYDGDGEVQQFWNKSRMEGRPVDEAVKLADPKTITKLSTLYDQQGRVTQQWVAEKPEDVARKAAWQDWAAAMAAELPRIEPTEGPAQTSAHLLAEYPIGDHHTGLLAWAREVGAAYDMTISERLLCSAAGHLIDVTPPCDQALITVLGDFFHYDGYEAVTPQSGHRVDADSRPHKMVEVGIRTLRRVIDLARARHKHVHIIVEVGNHDIHSAAWLMLCLAAIYENEPRVTVDTTPGRFHYFEFGKCLIGTHHGDGVKMDKLPLIMAADRPEAWGRTKHRYIRTGHIHHFKAQDFAGATVESFRVLPPTDAWAQSKGYRAVRDMKAIILHREYGEVARHTANPAMFEGAEE